MKIIIVIFFPIAAIGVAWFLPRDKEPKNWKSTSDKLHPWGFDQHKTDYPTNNVLRILRSILQSPKIITSNGIDSIILISHKVLVGVVVNIVRFCRYFVQYEFNKARPGTKYPLKEDQPNVSLVSARAEAQ